jgi:hypothetical protein
LNTSYRIYNIFDLIVAVDSLPEKQGLKRERDVGNATQFVAVDSLPEKQGLKLDPDASTISFDNGR